MKCLFAPEDPLDINYKQSGRALLVKFLNIPEARPSKTPWDALIASMVDTKHNPGIKDICMRDPLIKMFGESLLDRFGPETEQRVNDLGSIRGKIRCVARLLKVLNTNKDKNSQQDLEYYICGRRFREVCDAVKRLTEESNSPGVALQLGHYLKRITLLKISHGIENDDQVTKNEGKEFKQLMETHWKNRISKAANRRKGLRQLNKPEVLPLTEDLLKLKGSFIPKNHLYIISYRIGTAYQGHIQKFFWSLFISMM